MKPHSAFESTLNQFGEVGYVVEIISSIVRLSGLPHAHPGEVIFFESGVKGFVYTIDEASLDVILLSTSAVKIGERAGRSGEFVTIDLSANTFGSVLNSLGEDLYPRGSVDTVATTKYKRNIFASAPSIAKRLPVDVPFETGVAIVDLTVPLGRGQRELVVGDRKTGKTQFLMQVLLNQAKAGTACIYCAIGKRDIEIAEIVEIIKKAGIQDNVTVVASSSHEGVGQIYLTPFTAMTIAEYLRDQGKEVFLILDDLSTHAQFYRELALLARRFPGRGSYPGDIFHIHAQLLERAGNFHFPGDKHASITCLPVAQSVLGDITGYITTNLMSMTDGHIYLDTEIFDQGRRPAVNPFVSVTRVGHQTQSALMRDVSRELTSFLIEYRRAQEYSHFGSEVSEEIKGAIARGKLIYSIFDQAPGTVIPAPVTTFLLAHLWAGTFKAETAETLKKKVMDLLTRVPKDAAFNQGLTALMSSASTFKDLIANVHTLPI